MAKRKKKKHSRSGKNRTSISGHTHAGQNLLPPFAKLGDKVSFSSWMNERLPEMLWAILIRAYLGQDKAVVQFRRILDFITTHEQRELLSDITLSGIAQLEDPLRDELISHIVEPPEIGFALSTLKLFESLPARESWLNSLPDHKPDIELLMTAVGTTLWHQSQESTDCRWLRVMTQVVTGKLQIPEDTVKLWLGYPNEGDQRSVRPSIRSAEMISNPIAPHDLTWPNAFWDESWKKTSCFVLRNAQENETPEPPVNRERLTEILSALEAHWESTHSTTEIDAKHDAVFGMAFYSLRLLEELLGTGVSQNILGRIGLRTIMEVRINLRYLISINDDAKWEKWRTYGAGQAKLNALRFDLDIDAPRHIDVDSIEQIAGEDLWEELLSINLGGWSGANLRKMSEKSGQKMTYDQHYSWTSGYAHGTWGPVREACYQTCGNPLHRLHRYPERKILPDAFDDAAALVDNILDDLSEAYPDFPERILTKA